MVICTSAGPVPKILGRAAAKGDQDESGGETLHPSDVGGDGSEFEEGKRGNNPSRVRVREGKKGIIPRAVGKGRKGNNCHEEILPSTPKTDDEIIVVLGW